MRSDQKMSQADRLEATVDKNVIFGLDKLR